MAAVVLFAAPAGAFTVTYSTSGIFNAYGSNQISSGPDSLTFKGISAGTSVDAPTNASLGEFDANIQSGDTLTVAPTTFTLTVTQTVPSSGGTSATSNTLQGTISNTKTGLTLTFNGAPQVCYANGVISAVPAGGCGSIGAAEYQELAINGVFYGVPQSTLIVPTNTNGGVTTLEGFIALPEPTFYGLTAIGFAGLLAMAIRRKKQNKAVA